MSIFRHDASNCRSTPLDKINARRYAGSRRKAEDELAQSTRATKLRCSAPRSICQYTVKHLKSTHMCISVCASLNYTLYHVEKKRDG